MTNAAFDAVLLVSFGGPEGPDDVLPFLDNVLRGRNVPQQRKLAVARRYERFGGVSPINQRNRALVRAIERELAEAEVALPVYWGNRTWHPLLVDTLRCMQQDGIQHALALLTSPFASYPTCREYLNALEQARHAVGREAPRVSKLRAYFNHPRFVDAWCDRLRAGLSQFDEADGGAPQLLFTAHSIPVTMAESSQYVQQLSELAQLIAFRLNVDQSRWRLVYQSRSGPPHQPWLEPDVRDVIAMLGNDESTVRVLLAPIGFLSDHMEVVYDLDVEAARVARQAGVEFARAKTLGTHPQFVSMVRELIDERVSGEIDRPVVGSMGAAPDVCPGECCRCVPAFRH